MTRLNSCLPTLALCLLALPGRAATDGVNAKLTEAAAAIEQALEHSSMPGLVVGITDRHELRKVIVHGYGDLKTRKPLTADSLFAIGSISKAFTAIALMQIGQEHRFEPHAPITRYLPSLVVHSRFAPITGHDLMSHTSGLPNYLPDSASSRYAAIELKDFEPSYAPGTHWWYSNTGFQLLGYALEISNMNLIRKFFGAACSILSVWHRPPRSSMTRNASAWWSAMCAGLMTEDSSKRHGSNTRGRRQHRCECGGHVGLRAIHPQSGAGDKGRVLSESAFATLTTPVLENYAYGLWVRKENGRTVISHTGSIGGFHAAIEAHMEDGFGLVSCATPGSTRI